MLTTLAVPDDTPVLIGPLCTHRFGPDRGRPVLSVRAWCPHCRDFHSVDLPTDFAGQLDAAVPIVAPCRVGAWIGQTLYLSIDPTRATDARRMVRAHAAALRRFLVERRLRHQFAAERSSDRAHTRSGWDVVENSWLRGASILPGTPPPDFRQLAGGLGRV